MTDTDAGLDLGAATTEQDDADTFAALVGRERQAIGRARFAGRDPVVRGPIGARAAAVVARLLAADREGAPIDLGAPDASLRINPAEDRAEDALQRALAALARWRFDAARRDLSVAAALARIPARQQRIELVRALVGLLRAVVLTEPGAHLRGEDVTARGVLIRLDALPLDERDHYAAEIARLLGHWRAAATNDDEWRAWALLRGRLALRAGGIADEAALAWALRAWDRATDEARSPSETLAPLLDAARNAFRPLVDGAGAPVPLDARGKALPSPYAGDVLTAVAAALAARDGLDDAFASTRRFALAPFHLTTDARADEGTS